MRPCARATTTTTSTTMILAASALEKLLLTRHRVTCQQGWAWSPPYRLISGAVLAMAPYLHPCPSIFTPPLEIYPTSRH